MDRTVNLSCEVESVAVSCDLCGGHAVIDPLSIHTWAVAHIRPRLDAFKVRVNDEPAAWWRRRRSGRWVEGG